jgi:serine/threonine-protein kinase
MVLPAVAPGAGGPETTGGDRPRFRRDAAAAAAAGAAGAAAGAAEPTPAPAAARTPRDPAPTPAPVPRSHTPHRRAWAVAAVAAGCLAVGAGAALISDDGNDGRQAGTTKARTTASQGATSGSAKKHRAAAKTTTSTAAAPAAGAASSAAPASSTSTTTTAATDGRSAAQLNNAGYAMLPGDPQGALPLLTEAVQRFRAQGDTQSTDYAYALYNLGWALRLAGRPAEAIPYLQERLRISDYKRGVVEQELRTAQQAAGQDPTARAGAAKGKAKGKGKGKKGD